MTRKEFWKSINNIISSGMSTDNIQELAELLMRGYNSELTVFEVCGMDPFDEEIVYQMYSGSPDKRLMLCSSNLEKGKRVVLAMEKKGIINDRMSICVTDISCKHMLDNLYFKKTIDGLIFNAHLNDQFIVPANVLRPLIEANGKAEIPENFAES